MVMPVHAGHQGQDVIEIFVDVQPVDFGAFHQAVDGSTGAGAFGRNGK